MAKLIQLDSKVKMQGAIERGALSASTFNLAQACYELGDELAKVLPLDTDKLAAAKIVLEIAFDAEISIAEAVNSGVERASLKDNASADRLKIQIQVLELEESIAKKSVTKPGTTTPQPASPMVPDPIPFMLNPGPLPMNHASVVVITQPCCSRRVVLFPGLFSRR